MPHAAMSKIRRLALELVRPDVPPEVRAAAELIGDAALVGWQLAVSAVVRPGATPEETLDRMRVLAEAEGLDFHATVEGGVENLSGRVDATCVGMPLSERIAAARLVLVGSPVPTDKGGVHLNVQQRRYMIIRIIEGLAPIFEEMPQRRAPDLVTATADGLLGIAGVRPDEALVEHALLAVAGLVAGGKWPALAELCGCIGEHVDSDSVKRMYFDEQARVRGEFGSRE